MVARVPSLLVSVKPCIKGMIISLKVNGIVHRDDFMLVAPILTSLKHREPDDVSLLFLDVTSLYGGHWEVLFKDGLNLFSQLDVFDRIAIFGDSAWQRCLASACNSLKQTDIAYFDSRVGAEDWIAQ